MKQGAMEKTSLKVLYLEDSPHDVEIIRELLTDAGYNLSMDCTEKKKEFISLLKSNTYDIILSDFSLPGFDAFGALELSKEICPNVPFICVSGSIGEEIAIELIKKGAVDYVLKDRLVRFPLAIKHALNEVKEKKSVQQAEKALHESEQKFRETIVNLDEGYYSVTLDGVLLEHNMGFSRIFGFDKTVDLKGRHLPDFWKNPDDRKAYLKELIANGFISHYQINAQTNNGKNITVLASAHLVKDTENRPLRIEGIFLDITERKRAEEALRQSAEQYQITFENTGTAIVLIEEDTTLSLVNKKFEYLSGYSKNEIEGKKKWTEFVVKEDLEHMIEQHKLRRKNAEAAKKQYEFRFVDRSRAVHHILLYIDIIKGTKKSIASLLDITKRKQAETTIVKLNRTYAVLSNINQLIVREQDKQKLFEGVCKIAVEDGHFLMSWIGILDENTGRVEPVASAGAADGYLEQLHISISDTPDGKGPTGTAFREGRHVICNDIEHDDRMIPWRKRALELGYKSSAAFPLHVLSKTIGTLNFYSSEVHFFNEDEVHLLEDLASDISFALESLKKEEERKLAENALIESEEKFRKIFNDHAAVKLLIDPDSGKIKDANKSAADYYGWSCEELKRMNIDQINILTPEEVKKEMGRAKSQKKIQFEFKHRRKDGSIRDVEVFSSKIEIGNKDVLHSIVHDITERKKMQEALVTSEISYRRLFESAKDGILILDAETGLVVDVNPYLIKMLGYSHLEFKGKAIWKLGLLKDIFANQNKFLELQQKEYIHYEDLPLETADGRSIHVEFVSNVYHVGHKKVIQCNIRDITERKQAEQEIRTLSNAVEQSSSSIIITNLKGEIEYVNSKFVELAGYSAQETIGKNPRMLKSEHTSSEEYKNLWIKITNGQVWHGEFQNKKKNGELYWESATISPIKDADGKIIHFLAVKEDITQQKKMAEELRQIQKLEGLGTLAGGIAHDFNNILGIILAYITSINRFKGDTKKLNLATDTIVKAVERGKTLVQQVLTFARKTETTFGAVNVNDVIMEIVSMIYEMFPKNVTSVQNLEKSIPYINADRSQLHQVLMNLCVNARDAMPKGGVLTINTRIVSVANLRNQHPEAAASSYVSVEVSDTGDGMTEEIRKRIFEPFFTTKGIGKGTGLGLSVVFGVIQAHNGFIDVESELGRGTTFRIYLPVTEVTEPFKVTEKEILEDIPGGTETLLVIEDEEMLLMPLQMALVEKGYKVISAKDGLMALQIYKERKADISLVLTDLGLPNISGLEVCQRIKKINTKERFILATGFLDPDIKKELLEAGIQHFLYKPYDLTKVLKVVREVIDKKL